ncbi:olfactory receptor 5P81-like [Hyperolius riggenbachi]|uniref:olfactory receptor 5P81-like n=1 Tax=Hyperolius riggenbachi TaxID=752182 RepID=UPI0035A357D0
MCEANQTQVTQIHLLGFQAFHKFKALIFIGFLLIYMIILCGNLLIIILVITVDHLKIPMYFFLKHLATADVLFTSSVVPLMLYMIVFEEGKLSVTECIVQIWCSGIFGLLQSCLIVAMSIDRFIAICSPLRYSALMSPRVCLQLVAGSWFLDTLITSSEIILVAQLSFCNLNYIDFFFCDFGPLVELSTSDTSGLIIQDLMYSILTLLFPFVFIIITYICISYTVLKISSIHGRRKAFSTCSSHLVTVCTYYGTLITVYMVPINDSTVNLNKYISVLYIGVPPLMNPIIYSLRNQEIKRALHKLMSIIRSRMEDIEHAEEVVPVSPGKEEVVRRSLRNVFPRLQDRSPVLDQENKAKVSALMTRGGLQGIIDPGPDTGTLPGEDTILGPDPHADIPVTGGGGDHLSATLHRDIIAKGIGPLRGRERNGTFLLDLIFWNPFKD